jgi:acyl-coenzyme A synthetase/AMP-(fatty) acid ligase/3-hydroxymyristoyl/3-hydroxydecanoyl-(acyl carrier protein) dehydratase
VLSTVPLSHLYGLLFGALLPLRSGARIVSHAALLPVDIAALIEREAVDLLISTPAHLRAMADTAMPRGLRVISSGARLPPELHISLAAGHGWQITDVLGTTETGGIATRQHPISPWVPLPGVVVSAPDGQLVATSPWCAPPGVQVDDRIELRPDGAFDHLGRNHELVKIAGKRAHAHELEATVLAVPGVIDVAVLVHAATGNEARVAVAVSVAADGPAVGRAEITAAIRRQFDAVFVPRMVRVVPRIPRTDRGKVDREALRELFGITTTTAATTSEIPVQRVGPGHYTAVIPNDLVFFRGHFDAFTILPGAVIIERLVWPIVKAELPEVNQLRGIRRLRFRRPVMPDQQLSIRVNRDRGRLTFEVTCADSVVASGQLVVD